MNDQQAVIAAGSNIGSLEEVSRSCKEIVMAVDRGTGLLTFRMEWALSHQQMHTPDPNRVLEHVLKDFSRFLRDEADASRGQPVIQMGPAAAIGNSIGSFIGGMIGRGHVRARIRKELSKITFSRAVHDLTREERIVLKASLGGMALIAENEPARIRESYAGEFVRALGSVVWGGARVKPDMPTELFHSDWAEPVAMIAHRIMCEMYGDEAVHIQRMGDWAGDAVDAAPNLKGSYMAPLFDSLALTGASTRWYHPKRDPESSFKSKFDGSALLLGFCDGEMISFDGEESLITIAGPGAGKTQCHVLPNVLVYDGSIIVLDVKGEVFDGTAESRRDEGKRVMRFSLVGDDGETVSYNPLDFVSRDPDQLWDDAVTLSGLLIDRPAKESDPFWTSSARDLVTTYLAATVLLDDNPTLEGMMDRIMAAGDERLETLSSIAALGIEKDCKQLEQTAKALIGMAGDGARALESVFATVREKLSVLHSAAVRRVSQKSDWRPEDFREAGTSLYLAVPLKRIEALAPFLRVVLGQHILALTEKAPPRGSLPITLFLDELPQLGNFDAVVKAIEVGRSYGLRVWGFAQNPQQIETAFTRSDVLLNNPAVRCYMNIDNIDIADRVSRELGEVENALTGEQRPFVKPNQLMNDPEFKNVIIALGRGVHPARLQKAFAYDFPVFKNRRERAE